MSDEELTREADVQQVGWRLNESLKACQAMVANYRLMLGGVANDNQASATDGNETIRANDAEEA